MSRSDDVINQCGPPTKGSMRESKKASEPEKWGQRRSARIMIRLWDLMTAANGHSPTTKVIYSTYNRSLNENSECGRKVWVEVGMKPSETTSWV